MAMEVICGLLVVAAFLVVLLRQYRPELALGLGVLVGVFVMAVLINGLAEPLKTARQWLEKGGVDGSTVTLLVKALGICLLTQLAADVCRDAGENGLASRAELVGKMALLMLAIPVFSQLVELAVLLIEGGVGG